jgi:threonine dehydratase
MTMALVTLPEIEAAAAYVHGSGLVRRTPLLRGFSAPTLTRRNTEAGPRVVRPAAARVPLHLKLESLQHTGSFKIRGMTNVFRVHEDAVRARGAVTLSAGNAGRSFAFLCGRLGVDATVCMPDTVPRDRVRTIEALGAAVELVPGVGLLAAAERHVAAGRTLIHPFDDKDLIAGHGSIGLEILEDLPDLGAGDVVAVCCGGGGLVSGVAAALKLKGCAARVVAVEPEGSACMTASVRLGRPAVEPADFTTNTVAHGLAPPFAGAVTYAHVTAFVDDVVTVTDAELIAATRVMYEHGFVCETSGCAGVAAAMAGRLGPLAATARIVCVVSGSNISTADMHHEMGEGATATGGVGEDKPTTDDCGSVPTWAVLAAAAAAIAGFAIGSSSRWSS